tara:strand:+ start:356 stop:544 length:189 start_codon:yes stop_codon:yes gene_type:complete
MATYTYKCTEDTCVVDVIEVRQSMNDDSLTVCEECGNASLVKIITGGSFVLKGKGWTGKLGK